MAYLYQFGAVLGLVRAFVKANLTAQGETPASLPNATSAMQVMAVTGDYPLTVLQVGKPTFDRSGVSLSITMPVTVNHIREAEGGTGEAAITGLTRLAALATALEADYRLLSVGGAAIPVQQVEVREILIGDDNPVQQMLDMTNQTGLQAVALMLDVTWVEAP